MTTTYCSCPGCSQPGILSCSYCQLSLYCSVTCQKKDWPSHKATTCEGQLLKQGLTHLKKAKDLGHDGDYEESLRYNNLALTVLHRLKDRPPTEILSDALELKCSILENMGLYREALESAKERYTIMMTPKRTSLDSTTPTTIRTMATEEEEDNLTQQLQRQIDSLRCELFEKEKEMEELQRIHDEDLAKQIAVFESASEEKATKIRDLEGKCRLHEEEGRRRQEQLLEMDDDKKVGYLRILSSMMMVVDHDYAVADPDPDPYYLSLFNTA